MKTIKPITKIERFAERVSPWFAAFCLGLSITFFAGQCQGQSFFTHKHHSYDNRNIKTTTIGQRLRTKVKYARKRFHSEGFAFREMRRKSRGGRL